ncbi:uncharacterized protein LOC108038202 [Drosophila rhopaloa]|uniref:Uncharacterized protein LOC108038202 n=1 Tax=Drosophila rhopaloa TaxID=1041015 RepID=A0A6P4E5A3_DRORH|nr:uncharacterized protein LOC108038202 [Drosophila rhopaloa]
MRALCVLILIAFLGIALISTKPFNETRNREEGKPLNKTEISKIMEELKLLEKLANETYYSPDPTNKEAKEPTAEELKDPTGEETQQPTGEIGEDGEIIVQEEEEEDDATLDKPTDAQPANFLKYPAHEPDFKAYPRFAILRNGYVHHMNLNF